MSNLTVHSDTAKLIRQLIDSLPQGILLKGAEGVGLRSIAHEIAGNALINIVRPTDRDGNTTVDGSGEIRIPQIRALLSQLKGRSITKRVVIIDDADRMNLPAQQAFLKLLEEPTQNTHFILTAHNPQVLVPTIRSRVQSYLIKPISTGQSTGLIKARGEADPRRTQQLLFLADGKPAEISRLLSDTEYFATQVVAVEDARQFLQGRGQDRVAIAQKYHNNRPGALLMLEQAIRIVRTTLKQQATPKLVTSLELLAQTHERIAANGNIRLQLLNFVVQ